MMLTPLAGCVLTCALTLTGASPQDEKRIEELEKRVAQLERKLAELQVVLRRMTTQGLPKVQGAIERAIQRAKITSCWNNLSQLWKMQHIYASQFGGRQKQMVQETGPAFWLALSRTPTPLIDEANLDIYVCPVTGKDPAAGFTTYRGPAKRVQSFKPEDPIGCCTPGDHPDGTINVLLKSGDVKTVGPDDPLYTKAMKGTAGASEKK